MSDDTRQARIEAAMAALFQGERGDVALGYYAVRSRMAAALEAADAIGRERVSEADARKLFDDIVQLAVDAATAGRPRAALGFTEQLMAKRSRLIALLTAAPAERGDTAETAIEAARELLLMLHMEVMTGAILTTPAVASLMTELDKAIFAWDAADAAAAPAVGVTVAWLDTRIAEQQEWNRAGDTAQERSFYAGQIAAFDEVRALLTAQPEPGTHDDAGQPGEGGVTE